MTQSFYEPDGLDHEALQLRQNRAVGVRLKVDVLSLGLTFQDPGRHERSEFALEARRPDLKMPREVTQKEGALRVKQEHGEELLPGLRE